MLSGIRKDWQRYIIRTEYVTVRLLTIMIVASSSICNNYHNLFIYIKMGNGIYFRHWFTWCGIRFFFFFVDAQHISFSLPLPTLCSVADAWVRTGVAHTRPNKVLLLYIHKDQNIHAGCCVMWVCVRLR